MPRTKQENVDYFRSTGSRPFSTTRFFYDKTAAARYAVEMQRNLEHAYPLTIIIEPDSSEGFFVHSVTGLSSDDIQTLISSRERPLTFDKTQDG